jgi:hypothetical protein
LNGIGQSAGEVDPQPAVDGEQAGIEGHIVGRASGQAVSEVKALGGGASMSPVPAATAAATAMSQTSGARRG